MDQNYSDLLSIPVFLNLFHQVAPYALVPPPIVVGISLVCKPCTIETLSEIQPPPPTHIHTFCFNVRQCA